MFFVEKHYLNKHSKLHSEAYDGTQLIFSDASFSENFYGLKRRRRPGVSSERAQEAVDLFTNHEALRRREVNLSLLFLVRAPLTVMSLSC